MIILYVFALVLFVVVIVAIRLILLCWGVNLQFLNNRHIFWNYCLLGFSIRYIIFMHASSASQYTEIGVLKFLGWKEWGEYKKEVCDKKRFLFIE